MKDLVAKPHPIIPALLFMSWGPILWSVHLLLTYVPQSMLCAATNGRFVPLIPGLVLGLAGLFSVLLIAGFAWPETAARLMRVDPDDHPQWRFINAVSRNLVALSFAGVVFNGMAGLLVDPCAQMR